MPLKSSTPFNTRFVFYPADFGRAGFRTLSSFNTRWRDVADVPGIYTSHVPYAGTVIGTKRSPDFPALAVLLDCMSNILWTCPTMFRHFHTDGRRWSQVEHGTNIWNSAKEFRVVATASPILLPPTPSDKRGHAEAWYADLLRQGSIIRREDVANMDTLPSPQSTSVGLDPEPEEGEDGDMDMDMDMDDPVVDFETTIPPYRVTSTPVSTASSDFQRFFTQANIRNPFSSTVVNSAITHARNS